jgi:hypothetical protein
LAPQEWPGGPVPPPPEPPPGPPADPLPTPPPELPLPELPPPAPPPWPLPVVPPLGAPAAIGAVGGEEGEGRISGVSAGATAWVATVVTCGTEVSKLLSGTDSSTPRTRLGICAIDELDCAVRLAVASAPYDAATAITRSANAPIPRMRVGTRT